MGLHESEWNFVDNCRDLITCKGDCLTKFEPIRHDFTFSGVLFRCESAIMQNVVPKLSKISKYRVLKEIAITVVCRSQPRAIFSFP